MPLPNLPSLPKVGAATSQPMMAAPVSRDYINAFGDIGFGGFDPGGFGFGGGGGGSIGAGIFGGSPFDSGGLFPGCPVGDPLCIGIPGFIQTGGGYGGSGGGGGGFGLPGSIDIGLPGVVIGGSGGSGGSSGGGSYIPGATSAGFSPLGLFDWGRIAAFLLGLLLVAGGLYLIKPVQQVINTSVKRAGEAAAIS